MLVPVIGIVAIVMASIALAITLEDELASDEPAGLLGRVPMRAIGGGRSRGRPRRLT